MDEKINTILTQISETGYKSYDDTCKEYNDMIGKYKLVQPDASEVSIQAHVLNVLLGKAPHPHDLKGYFLGVGGLLDQNKRARDKALKEGTVDENGVPVYMGMPKNRSFLEGKVIPSAEDSMVRVCYFFGTSVKEGQEENWKKVTLWNRVKGLVPKLMLPIEFKADGNFDKTAPSLGTLPGTTFKVTSQEPVNFVELVNSSMPENVCLFEDVTAFEQPKDYPVMIFKAQVVRATVTKDETMSNPVELRMPAETIEDVLKADNVENITVWCDKAVPIDFGEGDIVWCFGNKYVKQDGGISLKGFGFFVEKSAFPQSKPAPINNDNSKATLAPDTSENWGGDEGGKQPSATSTTVEPTNTEAATGK